MTYLAFDVYGTLINTAGVSTALAQHIGDQADQFAARWREKQLEYSFRRGLMRDYGGFPQCIRNALDYVCLEMQIDLGVSARDELMQAYRVLPAFDDALAALEQLQNKPARLFAFSNGMPADVESLLNNAGILKYFEDIVSVDEIKSFKPDPATYQHFITRSGAKPETSWLISSNPFDVIGAVNYGMQAAWINRGATVFDPWEKQPTRQLSALTELLELFD